MQLRADWGGPVRDREHIYPLDALRFFSAFCVMAFHLCFYDWANAVNPAADLLAGAARYEALAPFTWFGWVGVQIFFVISGFVIAHSAAGASPIAFLKGRVARLYPAVWVCATITFAVWLWSGQAPFSENLGAYLRSVSLWLRGPWVDGVYWSLAVEIVFYGLVFWMLVARSLLSITALPWMLTAWSLFYAFVHFAPHTAESVLSPFVVGKVEWFGGILLFKHGSFFAIGVWLWLMSRKTMNFARYCGLVLAIGLSITQIVPRASAFAVEVTSPWAGMAFPVWAPVGAWLAGVAVVFAAARFPERFAVRSPARQAALKRIGLMTYPLFLVHSVVGAALIRVLTQMGVGPWVALVLAMSAMLVLAYVICATAEVGIRNILRAVMNAGERALRRAAPGLTFLFEALPDRAVPARSAR
jgi:peptidoglycan/LPS O-acetylase OafA/YrhL